jgi:aldose 1-epimerase
MSDGGREFVTLAAGVARVDLLPGLGGRIAQITVGSRPLLRGPEHADLGWPWWGSYPMLPWANRIPDGVATFRGETITVPVNWPDGTAIHGLAYERPWDVVAAGPTEATLAIEVAVDRYRVRAEQRFALSPDGLDLEIDVVNVADWQVPTGVGIHPWFLVAPVRVPAELVWPGDGPMPDGPPRPVRPEEDLRRPVTAAPMDSFVCVEPQTMASDGIRMADAGVAGTGVIALDPGVTLSVGYRVSWPD